MQLTGIQQLTAISAKPRQNLVFYARLLGMRPVKKTVNQDDVGACHLLYAARRKAGAAAVPWSRAVLKSKRA